MTGSLICPPAVGGGLGRRQEAASGRNAAAGGCGEQAADPEGRAGLPEEHLQRGRAP